MDFLFFWSLFFDNGNSSNVSSSLFFSRIRQPCSFSTIWLEWINKNEKWQIFLLTSEAEPLTLLEAQEGDPLDGRVPILHVLVKLHQEGLLFRPALLRHLLLGFPPLLFLATLLFLASLLVLPSFLLLARSLLAEATSLVLGRRGYPPVGNGFTARFDLRVKKQTSIDSRNLRSTTESCV